MIQQNQSPVNCKLLPLIGCPDSAPDVKEKAPTCGVLHFPVDLYVHKHKPRISATNFREIVQSNKSEKHHHRALSERSTIN
ncbi:hypothetical protein CFP56_005049 [Quercus suber]|uniref:Uncharacterized protein n=1 Tax=Quercus suber TaxID=58331 RepID=A0AAW0LAI9_QUESU